MKISSISFPILLATMAMAQVAPGSQAAAPPVSYSSASELNHWLSQLQQTSQAMQLDLASLRIEKWKTDANTKQNTINDINSIQRNLKDALPEIMGRLQSSPENLPTSFELYRNLDALYDVFTSVVESAGAFGSRNEYQSMQNDLGALETERHSFADRVEKLASAKEGEVANLRSQLQKAQAVQEATPAKKVVVDDTEEPKKTVKKKSPAKKTKPAPATPTPTTPETQPPAQPQNPPPNPQP